MSTTVEPSKQLRRPKGLTAILCGVAKQQVEEHDRYDPLLFAQEQTDLGESPSKSACSIAVSPQTYCLKSQPVPRIGSSLRAIWLHPNRGEAVLQCIAPNCPAVLPILSGTSGANSPKLDDTNDTADIAPSELSLCQEQEMCRFAV